MKYEMQLRLTDKVEEIECKPEGRFDVRDGFVQFYGSANTTNEHVVAAFAADSVAWIKRKSE